MRRPAPSPSGARATGVVPAALLLVLGAALGRTAGDARGEDRPAVDAPRENSSFVPEAAAWLRRAIERAEEAAARKDWTLAVRTWQEIVEAREDPERAGAVVPAVVAVRGSVVYEGAWIVAHHRLASAGPEAMAAYAREVGGAARELVARAVATRRADLLAEVVERFLPLAEGRRAALTLADLAIERGDFDEAMGWLDRLEDIEEVSSLPEETLAPLRAARVARLAVVLARKEKWDEARAHLAAAAAPGAPEAMRLASPPVPPAWARPPPERRDWPTTGGDASRAALPPAMGSSLRFAWAAALEAALPPPSVRRGDPAATRAVPSPWIATRAVHLDGVAYVHQGDAVAAWELAGRSPTRLARERLLRRRLPPGRETQGWTEGHGLTAVRRPDGTTLVYATVTDEGAWSPDAVGVPSSRDDHLVALAFDGQSFTRRWRVGGVEGVEGGVEEGPAAGLRLHGAPLLYRDTLWIAGVLVTQATQDRLQAWLVGLDPDTGRVRTQTWLGSGGPVRPGRPDEAIPSSPAGAHGRVVVTTSMGWTAAVDARTGRPVWMHRYDRGVDRTNRSRRLSSDVDQTPRPSSFENQPPALVSGRCFVAPTDASDLFVLMDRPRGAQRSILAWRGPRRGLVPWMGIEQVVGVHPGTADAVPPTLVLAGKVQAPEGSPPPPIVAALDPFAPAGREGWERAALTGWGAETFGRALLTRAEVLVSTRHGIAIHALEDGRDLAILDRSTIPPDVRARIDRSPSPPFGNLVPLPGRGLLVVNDHLLALWATAPADD